MGDAAVSDAVPVDRGQNQYRHRGHAPQRQRNDVRPLHLPAVDQTVVDDSLRAGDVEEEARQAEVQHDSGLPVKVPPRLAVALASVKHRPVIRRHKWLPEQPRLNFLAVRNVCDQCVAGVRFFIEVREIVPRESPAPGEDGYG